MPNSGLSLLLEWIVSRGKPHLPLLAASFVTTSWLFAAKPGLLEAIDWVLFYKPNFHLLREALLEWRLPLWNPHIGLGRPFLADPQNAVFYPPVWLVVFGLGPAMFLIVWLHLSLAVIGMRRLTEELGAAPWAAQWAALAFMICGPMMGRLLAGQIMYCCALAYLPTLLRSTLRLEAAWSARQTAGHAALLALMFLCGHPQAFWTCLLGQIFFSCGRVGFSDWREARWPCVRALVQSGLAVIWCGLLVAAVLLPLATLVENGNRSVPALEFTNYGNLEPGEWLSLVQGYSAPRWESNLFVGVGITLAGLAGLLSRGVTNIRRLQWLALFGAGLGGGTDFQLLTLAHEYVPGFAFFRIPSRYATLLSFSLCISAALWLSQQTVPRGATAGLASGLIVIVGLAGINRAATDAFSLPLAPLLLFGIPMVCCLVAWCRRPVSDWRASRPMQLAVVLAVLEALVTVSAQRHNYSLLVMNGVSPTFPNQAVLSDFLRREFPNAIKSIPPRVFVPDGVVPSNNAMLYGYSVADGYTSLFLRRPWEYLHAAAGLTPSRFDNTFLSPRVYLPGPLPWPDAAVDAKLDIELRRFVRVENSSPRAFIAHAAHPPLSRAQMIDHIRRGEPRDGHVLVEQPIQLIVPTNEPLRVPAALQSDGNGILATFPLTTAPSLLVLAEAWYPGWQAEINNQTVSALPANGWMRAFPVPAGTSQARIHYREERLPHGALVSLVAGVAVILTLRNRRVLSVPAPATGHAVTSTSPTG